MTYKPLEMPEVVVLHHTDTPWARWQQAIHSSGIINVPYSVRSMTDTYLGERDEVREEQIRRIGFNADHLFIEDTLDRQNDGVDTIIHSQGFSSAPHTTWSFAGDRVTGLITAAGYNRARLELNSGIDSSSTKQEQRRYVGIAVIIMKPMELLAGRNYPEMPDGYGDDLADEQHRVKMRTEYVADIFRLKGVKNGLGWLAGKDYPDADRIRDEISSGCVGPFDVEYNVRYHRREFGKSLLRLEGLRQAIQQRRKN